MIAIQISSPGSPEVLRAVDLPKPVPGQGEVLIRVEAAGVAHADLLQRHGVYPPPQGASPIPGLDVAGTIDCVGPDVHDWKIGDSVCAIVPGGGYAEFCLAPALQVLPIPRGWSAIEAATLPENLFTVYDNLITRARLKHGETVLIHGGSSGIGCSAIMLSRAIGALPFVTAGTEEKCRACLSFGALQAINYKDLDFVREVHRITAGIGVNVVLDMIGGSYLARNLESLAIEGRLSIIAPQGCKIGQLDVEKLMVKRATILGSTMRSRSPIEKGAIAQRLLEQVWPLLPAKDVFRPIIDSTFPLSQAHLAHQRLESGQHIGKIVLTL